MAASHSLLARSLLRRIPQEERSAAVRDAVESVGQGSAADSDLALSLLQEHPDDGARHEFLRRLQSLIEAGYIDDVIRLCSLDVELQDELLQNVTDSLAAGAGLLQADPKGIVVPLWDDTSASSTSNSTQAHSPDDFNTLFIAVRSMLHFIKRILFTKPATDSPESLFRTILIYLGIADTECCKAARDALFGLLSSMIISEADVAWLWTCINKLIATEANVFYHTLAYTIWLRWTSSKGAPSQLILHNQYWQMLRHGLQHGDGERRKQCLSILRRSVATAVQQPSTRALICSADHVSLTSNAVQDQYERYCTVFETVMLGRYLNQIMECESDLNMLSSPQSAVKPEWLLALLASALTPKIQDSVRKFVGGCIMRSSFQPGTPDAFAEFLRGAFLPWATQGSLYTATLRRRDGRLNCDHGERLASYIITLLQRSFNDGCGTDMILDVVLDALTERRKGSFPYASIYLLEGLGRGFETLPAMMLKPAQLARLAELASWPALPEVARDYVHVRCIKICSDQVIRSNEAPKAASVMDAIRHWETLQDRLSSSTPNPETGMSEPIATWDSEPSKRDIMEAEAVEKSDHLRKQLAAADTSPADAAELLEDIWSDMEYLEYPKKLLVDMPALVLNTNLVRLAFTSTELAKTLANMVLKLQGLSENRVYLLSPLVCAVRRLALTVPEAVELMPLEGFIVNYAEHVPEATVDLQLEDATAQLLQSVAPEMARFGYEYYFGDREALGIAALLDLLSRLGANHSGLASGILDHLLQRWAKQKMPPPTVSPWKSTLQLQVMLLCCEQIVPGLEESAMLRVLDDLHYCLSIEPLPRYRYLLGWTIARFYLTHKQLHPRILGELSSKDHHSNPKYLASLMKIGVMIAVTSDDLELSADLGISLASVIVPLAASSKVIIRHEAQWQVPMLMDLGREKKWNEMVGSGAFRALDGYIRSLERFHDPPLERQLDRLDPIKDHTLTHLVEGNWFGLDSIESPLCGRADFVKLYKADARVRDMNSDDFPTPCMPLGDPVATPTSARAVEGDTADTVPEARKAELVSSKTGESRALQTKGTAYLSSDITSDSAEQRVRRRNDLIVVASLVDNPYNLGGLSRVSEIFGASELHLQNQNVTGNKDFTNVSVSSHLHLPIHQLSASAVPAFLAGKRDEGWTIVGIEQTDRSALLGSEGCKLPERVVLVLGSEKEGIPALVLGECDLLVEIPQQGVTRSLNVQTAAGIVLFEYVRQRCKTSGT